MNPPDPADEKLAAFLRSAERDPLPDDGFSARVLSALPPPRRASLPSGRDWLILGLAAMLLVILTPGAALADFSAFCAQTGDSTAGLLNSLVEEPLGLAVIALTVVALWLTAPGEEPLLERL